MLQADGQSDSHEEPACGGERVQVLESGRLAPAVPAGVPHVGGPQRTDATR